MQGSNSAHACHVHLLNGSGKSQTVILPASVSSQMRLRQRSTSGLRLVGLVDEQMEQTVRNALARTRSKHMVVFINSHGGDSEVMFTIMRLLKEFRRRSSEHSLTVVGTRDVGSAAFSIFLSIPKGYRFCLPSTKFFTHYCWSPILIRLTVDSTFGLGLPDDIGSISTDDLIARWAYQMHRATEQLDQQTRQIMDLQRRINRQMEKLYYRFAKGMGMDNSKHLLMVDRTFTATDVESTLLKGIVDIPLSALPGSLARPRPLDQGAKHDRYILKVAGSIIHA